MMNIPHSRLLKKICGEKSKEGKIRRIGLISILTEADRDISDYFIESTYKDNSGKSNKCYVVSLKGIRLILDNSKNFKNTYTLNLWYSKNSNDQVEIILFDRGEVDFINMLSETLKAFDITDGIAQYRCCDNSYRIDYYIPSLNIAIEYDESSHLYYSFAKDKGRQAKIEQVLKCQFIRVKECNTNSFNIGVIIRYLIKESLIKVA